MRQDINRWVITLGKILEKSLGNNIDIEKIALLSYVLIEAQVDTHTPIIQTACKEILEKMCEDYAWTCPYDTALCLGVLEQFPNHTALSEIIRKRLLEWNKNGMWGRNERDIGRLVATSRVLLFCKELNKDNSLDWRGTCENVTQLWRRDICEVGYIFKASAFIYISSRFKYMADLDLVRETIKMLECSIVEKKGVKYAFHSEVGYSSYEEVAFLLIALFEWKEYVQLKTFSMLLEIIEKEITNKEIYADYEGLAYTVLAMINFFQVAN